MRLSQFIEAKMEDILAIWEHDARESLAKHHLPREAIRDHVENILLGIAAKIDHGDDVRDEPSEFNADQPDSQLYAAIHGQERYELGVEICQVAREFRSLRMTVVELWTHLEGADAMAFSDMIRFNYEIDRVLEKSIERFTQAKNRQSRLYKSILSSLPDPCYILSLDGDFQYANQAMAELCGLSVEQIEGRSSAQMPLTANHIGQQELQRIVSDREYRWHEVEVEAASGETRSFETVHIPVVDERGEAEAISGIAHDITLRKDSEIQAWRHANYDPVAQLPNQRLFRDRLTQNTAHSQRTGDPFALLFIDIEGIREINERLGHESVNHLLRSVAKRLDRCVRQSDTFARIGESHFAFMLLDTANREMIGDIAAKILNEFERPFGLDEEEISVSGSVGITLFPDDGTSDQTLLRNAEEAMCRARDAGRNQSCFFQGR